MKWLFGLVTLVLFFVIVYSVSFSLIEASKGQELQQDLEFLQEQEEVQPIEESEPATEFEIKISIPELFELKNRVDALEQEVSELRKQVKIAGQIMSKEGAE